MEDKLLKFRCMAKLLCAQTFCSRPNFNKKFKSMGIEQLHTVCHEYYHTINKYPLEYIKRSCIRCTKRLDRDIMTRYPIKIDEKEIILIPYPDFIGDDDDLRDLIIEMSPASGGFCNEVKCKSCGKINYIRYYKHVDPDYMKKVPSMLAELTKAAADAKKTPDDLIAERDAVIKKNEELEQAINEIYDAMR